MPRSLPIALTRSLAVLGVALSVSCDDASQTDACDRYVEYMCDCHNDEYDCEQLRNTYADPDSATLDECAIALEDQEELDAGDCPTGGDTGV